MRQRPISLADGRAWSCAGSQQLGQAHQVAGGGRQGEHPADPGQAAVPRLAQAAGGLDPAERLLDALAQALADA